jgi:hypothetical protein
MSNFDVGGGQQVATAATRVRTVGLVVILDAVGSLNLFTLVLPDSLY